MQAKYSIKDLEQLSGIKAHTLRAWETRYNLIDPYRTSTNIRYYVDDHLKKILNISILVKSGMKIGQVAKMTDDELISSVTSVGKEHNPYDTQLNKLKVAMLEYDEAAFNAVLSTCFMRFGTDETLDRVIGVFINEVGFLWQIGAITVTHEHFISNLIKMKLLSLIDNLTPSYTSDSKNVVLFLPAGELHELSLLYLYYHLKNKGFRVFYLGQSLPLEYVQQISLRWEVDFYVCICTTQPHFEEVGFYFERIEELFDLSKNKFFLTGPQCENLNVVTKHSGIEVVSDVMSLKNILLQKR